MRFVAKAGVSLRFGSTGTPACAFFAQARLRREFIIRANRARIRAPCCASKKACHPEEQRRRGSAFSESAQARMAVPLLLLAVLSQILVAQPFLAVQFPPNAKSDASTRVLHAATPITLPKRRSIFTGNTDNGAPGSHWVTINGNHVLIHESEEQTPQQGPSVPQFQQRCRANQSAWEKDAEQARISNDLGNVHDLGLIVFNETQSYSDRPDSMSRSMR